MTRTNRRGADPPKDESGMTGDVYGICLAAKTSSNCQPERCKSTLEVMLAKHPACPLWVFRVYNNVRRRGD